VFRLKSLNSFKSDFKRINFENRLLTAHPEYHAMFPTIANVPMGEMLNNPALKVSTQQIMKSTIKDALFILTTFLCHHIRPCLSMSWLNCRNWSTPWETLIVLADNWSIWPNSTRTAEQLVHILMWEFFSF